MANTYHVRTDYSYPQGQVNKRDLVWDCRFAVVNEEPNYVIEVRKLAAEIVAGINQDMAAAAVASGHYELRNITALVGGTSITLGKHSSNESALPSQVKLVRSPQSVTTNGIVRRILPVSMMRYIYTTTSGYFPRLRQLSDFRGMRTNNSTAWNRVDNNEQPIVLREGEGISLYVPGGSSSEAFYLNGIVRTTGGATYSFSDWLISLGDGRASWAIFNGSGSGVVLELLSLDIEESVELQTTYPINWYRLLFGRMSLNGGEDLTPLKTDSSISDLPGGIKIRRSPEMKLTDLTIQSDLAQFWYENALLDNSRAMMYFNRVNRHFIQYRGPILAPFCEREKCFSQVRQSSMQGWRLNYGEGIAIVYGGPYQQENALIGNTDILPMSHTNLDISCWLTSQYVPPAGGGNTYARSRVVNA